MVTCRALVWLSIDSQIIIWDPSTNLSGGILPSSKPRQEFRSIKVSFEHGVQAGFDLCFVQVILLSYCWVHGGFIIYVAVTFWVELYLRCVVWNWALEGGCRNLPKGDFMYLCKWVYIAQFLDDVLVSCLNLSFLGYYTLLYPSLAHVPTILFVLGLYLLNFDFQPQFILCCRWLGVSSSWQGSLPSSVTGVRIWNFFILIVNGVSVWGVFRCVTVVTLLASYSCCGSGAQRQGRIP